MAIPNAVSPGAGIARRNGDHHIGLRQPVQKVLVDGICGVAGAGGAQGQVHRIAAQQDGIFDGRHVVRVIGAAVFTEDLHGEQLGVRGHTLNMDGGQSVGVTVFRGNVPVGRGDARHMGAVLSLVVVVVGDVQIMIHVVVAKGELLVHVQLLSRGAAVPADVQLGQLLPDFGLIQQIVSTAAVFCILRQGVCKGGGVKGLMVRIRAGVDDGNPGPRAGEPGSIGGTATDHLRGGGHVGVRRSLGVDRRFIPGLQHHGFHPGHGLNFLNLAIRDVGGDQIGRQGQVPHHVQGLAPEDLIGNPPGQGRLIGLQGLTGLLHLGTDGQGGSGQAAGRFHLLQARAVLQDDGDPNQVGGCIGRVLGDVRRLPLQGGVCLYLPEGDALLLGGQNRWPQGQHHSCHQQDGQNPVETFAFHGIPPF